MIKLLSKRNIIVERIWKDEQLFNIKEWRKEGVLVAYSHFDLILRTPTDEKQYVNLKSRMKSLEIHYSRFPYKGNG
jgi:DNA-binding sugar fermentation-stimulating protein